MSDTTTAREHCPDCGAGHVTIEASADWHQPRSAACACGWTGDDNDLLPAGAGVLRASGPGEAWKLWMGSTPTEDYDDLDLDGECIGLREALRGAMGPLDTEGWDVEAELDSLVAHHKRETEAVQASEEH